MRNRHAAIAVVLIALTTLTVAVPLATPEGLPISMSVIVVGKELREIGDTAYIFVYITNKAPLNTINFRGYREALGNVLTIQQIDTDVTVNDEEFWSFTQPVTATIEFAPPYDSITRTITSTPRPPYVGRINPVVLPGESVAVYFTSWATGCEEPAGVFKYTFTVHALFQGSQITLKGSEKFAIKRSFPACVGISMHASGTGVAIAGAGMTLKDLDLDTNIATGSTDLQGICFFAASDVPLVTGHTYMVEVTYLPPPFTQVIPDETYPPIFIWYGSTQYVVFTADL